jgi:hypothetical protein
MFVHATTFLAGMGPSFGSRLILPTDPASPNWGFARAAASFAAPNTANKDRDTRIFGEWTLSIRKGLFAREMNVQSIELKVALLFQQQFGYFRSLN